MTEEEMQDLLEIGCCYYHDQLCEKAHNYIREYEQRINKAIEYIKQNEEHKFAMNYEYGLNEENIKELLEILGDKENE